MHDTVPDLSTAPLLDAVIFDLDGVVIATVDHCTERSPYGSRLSTVVHSWIEAG